MTALRSFPVSFAVAGRPVLVIGDGERALRKLRLLVRTQARLVLHAAAPIAELAEFAAAHAVTLRSDPPALAARDEAALAFIALDDAAQEAALAACARAAGIPVNVVDRPALSDFAVPAIVERAPLAVAISTDGASPVVAQRLRARIEQLLSPGIGRVAELAGALRAAAARHLPDPARRRRFWSALTDGPAADAATRGDRVAARRLAIRALHAAARDDGARDAPGKVYLVGAGPGSPDLLTLRAQRLLQDADVIVHDALVPDDVVAMGRRDARRIAVGKRKGRHSAAQHEIDSLLVELARTGQTVVRLKSGDPSVFARAGEEIAALRAAGIDYEIVPGITAACAAAADIGAPLTLRGVASSLVVATGHGASSDPLDWRHVAATSATVALYMGASVADRVATHAIAAGLPATTPFVAVENAGRPERRILAGTLAELPALAERRDLDGPVVILVGAAFAQMVAGENAEPFGVVPARRHVA